MSSCVVFEGVGGLGDEGFRVALASQWGLGLGVRFEEDFGWRVPLWGYDEDHSLVLGDGGVGDVVVPWHLESPNWFFPQLAAGWWMDRFRCVSGAGLTGFVDGRVLWRVLPERLRRVAELVCVVWFDLPDVVPVGWRCGDPLFGRVPVWFEVEGGGERLLWGHPVLQWCRGEDVQRVLRVFPSIPVFDEAHVAVVTFQGEPVRPGSALWDDAAELQGWVADQVVGNAEGLQDWLGWVEGQFRLVDLWCGYHAVSGGFSLGERHLTGFWGHDGLCLGDPVGPPPGLWYGVRRPEALR